MAQRIDAAGNVNTKVLKDMASEEKGEIARLSSFVGAIAIADLVKTTLGPKGMDKILKPNGPGPGNDAITVTNDGATILKSIFVDNPAARILIDISKTQDDEVGDGTTTVAVLAGELLREGEKLINMKIHPQHIVEGWRKAKDVARKVLNDISLDHSEDETKFREDLLNIARTTLSSKLLTVDKEHFSKLAVDAVLRLKGSNHLNLIKVMKKPGGSLKDSFLSEGFIIDCKIAIGCPKKLENAKILLANTPMDYDRIKIFGTRVKTESFDDVAEIEKAEKEKMKGKCEKIAAYKSNVFINRQLIYDYPEEILKSKGILVIEHADFDGIERLAFATGGEILSTFDAPERSEKVLVHCNLIDEVMIGEEKLLRFSGCKSGQACTIVLRGASTHLLDEAERSLHDALCVLAATVKNRRVIYGGGNSEISMSIALDELAKHVKGKQALAIEGFSKALRQLPTILSDNAGYDSAELVQALRVEIAGGNTTAGLDLYKGEIGDMSKLGVRECLRVKEQALVSAAEAAEMIMRVDDIIRCAPRPRERM
jgi:T-complex protein 1 subunit beta